MTEQQRNTILSRWRAGTSMRQIARELRLSWSVVRRYARSERCPDWRPGRAGPSQADGYGERIDAWLAAGNRNVAELHRQLQLEGSALRYDTLRRFVTRRLAARGEQRERVNVAQPLPAPVPSAKGLSFAVIAKPAERTPLTAIRIGELAREAGLPDGVFQVLPGKGSVVGQRLVDHEHVRKIVFTGSTEVGQQIMAGCARQVKRLTLELGGKAANIVFADAAIDQAIEGIVNGIYFNQGHVCCAGSRLLVE